MVSPLTSQTNQPGYQPTPLVTGQTSNPQWIHDLTQWLAASWAHGNRQLPAGWDNLRYGMPDVNNMNGSISQTTLMAFARYAADYVPGKDLMIDQTMPYVAPRANDYVETPEMMAMRIEQENIQVTQRNLAQQIENQRYGIDVGAETSRYGVDVGAQSNYNSQLSNIYGNQLQSADSRYGTNAQLALGGLSEDTARTQAAIQYAANPENAVAREYATRALRPPVGGQSNGPMYTMPISQTVAAAQGAYQAPPPPQLIPPPIPQAMVPKPPILPPKPPPILPKPPAPAPVQQAPQQQIQYEEYWPGGEPTPGYDVGPQGQIELQAPEIMAGNYWTEETRNPYGTYDENWTGGLQWQPTPGFAQGGGTRLSQFVVGDPQQGNRANPEMIYNPTNAPISVMPMSQIPQGVPRFATGTGFPAQYSGQIPSYADLTALGGIQEQTPAGTLPTYSDEMYQNLPSLKMLRGQMPVESYNQLNPGNAPGPFGTQLPESGALNYNRISQLMQDPVSFKLISSLYRAAGRDFAAEAGRAIVRAPLGNAAQGTLIRT